MIGPAIAALAVVGGLVAYAVSEQDASSSSSSAPLCKPQLAPLMAWAADRQLAVAAIPTEEPPDFSVLAAYFTSGTPETIAVAVTPSGKFYAYTDGAPYAAESLHDDYCTYAAAAPRYVPPPVQDVSTAKRMALQQQLLRAYQMGRRR